MAADLDEGACVRAAARCHASGSRSVAAGRAAPIWPVTCVFVHLMIAGRMPVQSGAALSERGPMRRLDRPTASREACRAGRRDSHIHPDGAPSRPFHDPLRGLPGPVGSGVIRGEALMLAVELVRRGAARHGGCTAVGAGAESMTFAEVDEAANPREVEEALLTHPAVTAAAVVGAPDETWVEAVTAFVTLRPGVQPPAAEEPRGGVRARLAGYKVPKEVHVVDALPLSPVGKVLRRALRDPLWGRS
jgi:AMP-binding enzyme C-terminal domain